MKTSVSDEDAVLLGLADNIGKNRTFVTKALKVLDLPKQIQTWIDEHRIETSHAIELTTISEPAVLTLLAKRIATHGMTIKALGSEIKTLDKPQSILTTDPDIVKKEQMLTELVGSPTHIDVDSSGKYSFRVECHDFDVFDGVAELLERGHEARLQAFSVSSKRVPGKPRIKLRKVGQFSVAQVGKFYIAVNIDNVSRY